MKREKWLQIPVSEREHAAAMRIAGAYGMTLSDFVRSLLMYADDVRPQLTIKPKPKVQTK